VLTKVLQESLCSSQWGKIEKEIVIRCGRGWMDGHNGNRLLLLVNLLGCLPVPKCYVPWCILTISLDTLDFLSRVVNLGSVLLCI
jgi:hypothetical protein